jgi:small subunit ribosomal protein S13
MAGWSSSATTRGTSSVKAEEKKTRVARIAGVDIPREKRVEISLTYIFGIGSTVSKQVCASTDVDPNTRVRDLTDEEVSRLRNYIDASLRVEGDLRRDVAQDIKRKQEINCYQGIRHRRGLPVHGQRTHTNARTRKGPKKTVAGKKKVRK